MEQVPPDNTGEIVQPVGIVRTPNIIKFSPDLFYIEIA